MRDLVVATSALRCATPSPWISRARPPLLVREDIDDSLCTAVDRTAFKFGTVEQSDLPECVTVLMDGFYKDILTLARDEFTEEEVEIMKPALSVFNGAFMELTRVVLNYEANKRLKERLPFGGVERGDSERGDLMLVLQHRETNEIVAVGELSEQPKDGKVPGDLRLPALPFVRQPSRVAYISNLAVRNSWRGRGLGSALLKSLESVASENRKKGEVYLHAATAQQRLRDMYAGRGYEELPDFDQPNWVLALSGREETRYHRKAL